jgi:CheY-like chemotaxis protein
MSKRIFVIDDDAVTLLINKKLLQANGAFTDIETFKNAKIAIDRIKELLSNDESLPDVISLDLNMPIMNGWEFLDALALIPEARDIPVIMFTASINRDDRFKAETYDNLLEYCEKPLTLALIAEIGAKIDVSA